MHLKNLRKGGTFVELYITVEGVCVYVCKAWERCLVRAVLSPVDKNPGSNRAPLFYPVVAPAPRLSP